MNLDDNIITAAATAQTASSSPPSISSEVHVGTNHNKAQAQAQAPPDPRPRARAPVRQINIQHEREEIQILKQQVINLQKENNALKKNMGILYRSAKLELDRKDARVVRLEEELELQRNFN